MKKLLSKILFYGLGLYGAVLLFFALADLYGYWRMDMRTTGSVEEAQVRELSASSYDIVVTYTFVSGGQLNRATAALGKPYQLNQFSAQKRAASLKNTSSTVYFNLRDPSVSSLKREFPNKSLLVAGLTLGIWLYFWILRVYTAWRMRMIDPRERTE